MGLDFMTSVMPYGETWRTARRLLHTHLHQGVASKYEPTQIESARKFALETLAAKQDVGAVSHLVRSNFGRMMIKLVYGIDSEDYASEHLEQSEEIISAFSEAFTPGRFLVDLMPACEHAIIRSHKNTNSM
jgi:cytochrome P450